MENPVVVVTMVVLVLVSFPRLAGLIGSNQQFLGVGKEGVFLFQYLVAFIISWSAYSSCLS